MRCYEAFFATNKVQFPLKGGTIGAQCFTYFLTDFLDVQITEKICNLDGKAILYSCFMGLFSIAWPLISLAQPLSLSRPMVIMISGLKLLRISLLSRPLVIHFILTSINKFISAVVALPVDHTGSNL